MEILHECHSLYCMLKREIFFSLIEFKLNVWDDVDTEAAV